MILRDYQQGVHDWAIPILRRYKLAYIAMEMRTGKTPTALSIAGTMGAKKVLFFTKKKALPGIAKVRKELPGDFLFQSLNYDKLTTFTDVTELQTDDGDQDGYGSRARITHRLSEFFEAYLKPDFVILDEAHSLGQFPVPAGKIALLKQICQGLPILYLSGTPSPESFSQLYHQFSVSSFSPFIDFGTFYGWARHFVVPGKKYFFNREIADYSNAKKDLIDQYTKHLFMSVTQKEAGFEQEVEDKIIPIKMRPETYALAKYLLKDRIVKGKDGSVVLADTAVKMQQKLHQIYSGTVICEPEPVKEEDYGKTPERIVKAFDNSKAVYIRDNFKGQKFAIFYLYQAELMILITTFGYDRITSDPEEFETTDKIFVAQVVAGREGVDLSIADCLIMYNIGFSAVSYIQSRQRLNKKGRESPAPVYWLMCDEGIEYKIFQQVIVKNQNYTIAHFKKDYHVK